MLLTALAVHRKPRRASRSALKSVQQRSFATHSGFLPRARRHHRYLAYTAYIEAAFDGRSQYGVASTSNPYSAVQPPSIERLAPVIWAASSPQRNNASAATCSEVTNSLVGCAARSTSWMTCSLVRLRAFMVSGICFSTSGVQT